MKKAVVKNPFIKIPEALLYILVIFLSFGHAVYADTDHETGYIQVPGLIDTRSAFSDGKHSIEELAGIARSRGFRLLFINDHDRISLSYGIPPFRNLIRKKEEFPSIQTNGPEEFLKEIERVSKLYPDMIIIPGCETSAYYYWTGSYFNEDLTANDYDKRMLILNFNLPSDYNHIPNLHNKPGFRYTKKLLPLAVVFTAGFLLGVYLLFSKGVYRISGIIIAVISLLGLIDHNPFRSSLFTQYDGNQGIKPYQELIDYVNERGGLAFWNYPEQKSGVRKHGPIYVNTPPYPEVIHESVNYTGFSAIYGEYTSAAKPGGEWDRVLMEYCGGKRENPPWGISTADFHEDTSIKLGAYPTTLLVKEFSGKGVLDAIKNGRMYCSRGDSKTWPKLEYFNVADNKEKKYVMGESMTTNEFPVIKFKVLHETNKPMTLMLIRGGELIETINEKTPVEFELTDRSIPQGEKTYYRIIDSREHLVSNPIFVTYKPD